MSIPVITPATTTLPITSGVALNLNTISQDIINFLPIANQAQTAAKSAAAASVAAGGDGFHQAIAVAAALDAVITPAVPIAIVQAAGGLAEIGFALLNLIPNRKPATPTTTAAAPTPSAPVAAAVPSPVVATTPVAAVAQSVDLSAEVAQLQATVAAQNAQIAALMAQLNVQTPAAQQAVAHTVSATVSETAPANVHTPVDPAAPVPSTETAKPVTHLTAGERAAEIFTLGLVRPKGTATS